MRIIKYDKRTQNSKPIAFDDDRAMVEFRGFAHTGGLWIDRVSEVATAEVLEEVISNLQAKVQSRKKALA